MDSLPFELVDLILSYIPKNDPRTLVALEQTSTRLRTCVSARIHKNIHIRDSHVGAQRFMGYFLDAKSHCRQHVRALRVDVGRKLCGWEVAWELDASPLALSRIPELTNLNDAEIVFPDIWGETWGTYLKKHWRWCTHRMTQLGAAFSQCPQLTGLVLHGLRASRDERADRHMVAKLTAGVKRLRIEFRPRPEGPEEEKTLQMSEKLAFYEDLANVWLCGAERLESLQLGCVNSHWGSTPEFKLQNVSFSYLTTLRLESFSFHNDAHMDAICNIRTLQHLALQNCHILYCNIRSISTLAMTGSDRQQTCYWTPWAQLFTRIQNELPALESFTWTMETWAFGSRMTPADSVCRCHSGWTRRYFTCNDEEDGIYGDDWHEFIRKRYGRRHAVISAPDYPHFVRLDKMDWAALVRLQIKLGVPWNFGKGDEAGLGRSMLEQEDSQPVEKYAEGDDTFTYWGMAEVGTGELFDMEPSRERKYIRENLLLNRHLVEGFGTCNPDCGWPF